MDAHRTRRMGARETATAPAGRAGVVLYTLPRFLLPAIAGGRSPWTYDVELVERDGRVLQSHRAADARRAHALADTLENS